MKQDSARKQAKRAYKEQELTGGLYRVENTASGWQSPVLATVNLKGQLGKLQFAKNMGEPPPFVPEDVWRDHPRDAFAFVEVEALKKKPDQDMKGFRDDIEALFALFQEGGKEDG